MEEKRGFGSKIGFIMSMAAFCIGIGNMWKFPYVVGANGGGAFLLVYIICVFLIGIPMFMIEVSIGRAAQLSPIGGLRKLNNGKKGWTVIGWLETIAIACICIFSGTVIGGWSLGYVFKVGAGSLTGMNADEIGAEFSNFSGSWACVGCTVITAILLYLCLQGGVKKGVEKVCSVLMPTLLVALVVLAIYSNTRPGALEGLKWYLTPDFSKITIDVIGAAATQVYFSVGIGMCVAFVYGSYIDRTTALPGSLTLTAFMDTAVAFLAGLICTPALFAFDMEPTVGPSLVFVTLPQLFNAMGGIGRIFGTVFMLCIFAAGFSSWLGACEALVATITDATDKISRKAASLLVTVVSVILSIPVTFGFSTGAFSKISILGFGLFDFLDFVSSGFCMPICVVLLYIFAFYKWGHKKFQEEINLGTENGGFKVGNGIIAYMRFILPFLALAACVFVIKSYLG